MVSAPLPFQGGSRIFKQILKWEVKNYIFVGRLDDFTDKISFTYYKLDDNEDLTLLNQKNAFVLIKEVK